MNKKSKAKLILSIIIIIIILSTSTAIFVIYYPKTKISSKQIEKKKSIKAKETEDQESSESTVVEETKEEVVKKVVGNTEDVNSNVPTLDIQKFSEPKLESQTQNPIESIVNVQGSSVPVLDIEGPVEPKSESQIQDQIETTETETADQASNVDLVNGQNEDQIQRDGEYSNDEPLNNKPEPKVVETKEKLELENKKLTEEKQNIVLEPCSLIVGSWGCTIRNYDKTLRLQEIETRKEEIKNRLQEIKEQVIIDTPSDTKSPISSSQLINVEDSSHDESEPTVEETESMVEEPESEIVVQEIQVQDKTPGNDEDNAESVRKTTLNKDVSSDSSENDDSKNGEEPESEVVVQETQDQDESIESSNNEGLLSETKPLVDRTAPNDGEDTENGQSGSDELRDDVSSGKTEPVIEESEPVIEESEPMVEESENEDSNNEELLSQTKSLIDSTTQSDGQDTVNSDSGDDISSSESEVKESEVVVENTEVKDTEVEGSRELTMDEFLILIKTTPVNDFIKMFPPELIEDIEKLRSDLFILKKYGIGTIKLFIPPDFKENSHQLLELLKKKTAGEELEEVNYSCISYFKGLCYKWTTEPKTEEVADSIGGYNNEEILPQTKPLVESTTPSSDEDTKNSESRNDELGDDASSGEQTSKPVIEELEPVVEETEDKSSNNEEILPQIKSLVDSTTPSDGEDTENQEQENPYSEEELEKVLSEYETSPKPFSEEQKEELETYLEKHGDFTVRELYNKEQRKELEEYLLKLIDYITLDGNISRKLPLIIKYFELLDSLYIVEPGIDEEPESVFKEDKKDEIPVNDDSTESKIISSESISKPTVEESEPVIEETKPLVESTTPSDGEDTEDGESENDESGDGISSDEQTSKPVVEEVESVVEDSEPAIEESEKENSNNEELLLETKPLVESTMPSDGEDTEDGESENDESGDGISSLETEPVVEELEPVIEESENEEQDRTPAYDEEIIHVTYSTGEEEPKSIIIESQFQRIGVSTKTLVVNEEEHEETSSNPKIEPSSNIENTEEGIEVEGSRKLTVPSTLKVEEEINYDSEESEYQTIEDVEDQSKSDIQKEDGTTVERESEHSEEELATQLQIPILLPLIDFQSDSESRKKRMNGVLRESIVNEGINIELKKREEDTRDYNFSKLKKIAVIQNKIRIKEEKIKRTITRIKELNRNKIISPKHNKKRMKKIIKKIKKIKRIRNKIKKLTKKIIKKLRKLRKRTRNQRTSQSIINY